LITIYRIANYSRVLLAVEGYDNAPSSSQGLAGTAERKYVLHH